MRKSATLALVALIGALDAGVARASDSATDDADAELRGLLRLAEEQQAVGSFAAASQRLERALAIAVASGDARRVAAVRGALGNGYVAAGRLELAERELVEATALARSAGARGLAASLGNNLGNHFTLRAGRAKPGSARDGIASRAADAYAAALGDARAAGEVALATRILANHARLALETGDAQRSRALLAEGVAGAADLPATRENALTRVHLGRTRQRLIAAGATGGRDELLATHALLSRAEAEARALGDLRSAAWAQGILGALYAGSGRVEEGLTLTRRALFDAQRAGAPDAELEFQVQAARLLRELGREVEAIEAYRVAVEALAGLRPALGLGYGAESSLEAGPARAYRELVALLLARATRGGPGAAPERSEALRVMERFKAAELRDYFRDDCVDAWRARIATAADASLGALVVYPIVLEERLELLVIGRRGISQRTVRVSRTELADGVQGLRSLLVNRASLEYLPHARRLYDWLVRPWEDELAANPGVPIVFVPDGVLRTIPMAALHDGERFLVERRPVATTPGLELTDPRPLERDGARVFLGGISQAVQGFEPIPAVRAEIDAIRAIAGGEVLLDQEFAKEAVSARLTSRPYDVIHVASHGVLGAEPEESYLLAWDGRIGLPELSAWVDAARRQEPLEMLTLSACETAAGDERAALGLSGLAVKAGARSAIGALWKVQDAAAALLIVSFYRELERPGVSRAVALQRAQRELLADRRYRHPAYWAPFLLIGTWL